MTARRLISYVGREEHPSEDIAQVSQVEDVVEILLGKKLLLLKVHLFAYSGGIEDLCTANMNRNLRRNHDISNLCEMYPIILKGG